MENYEKLKEQLDKAFENLNEDYFYDTISAIEAAFESKMKQRKRRFKTEDKLTLKQRLSKLKVLNTVRPIKKYNKQEYETLKSNYIIVDDKNNEISDIDKKVHYEKKHEKKTKVTFFESLKEVKYTTKENSDKYVMKHVSPSKFSLFKQKLSIAKNQVGKVIPKVADTVKEDIGIALYIIEDKSELLGKNIKRKFEATKKFVTTKSKYMIDKIKKPKSSRQRVIDILKGERDGLSMYGYDDIFEDDFSYNDNPVKKF